MMDSVRHFLLIFLFVTSFFTSVIAVAAPILKEIESHQQESAGILPPIRLVENLENPMGVIVKVKPIAGMMYYRHEGPATHKISDNIPFFGLGGTIEWGNYFAEAYVLGSDKGIDGEFTITKDIVGEETNLSSRTNKERSFYRRDYSGAIGYTFNKLPLIGSRGDLSVFFGYRLGKLHHLDSTNITLESGAVIKDEVSFETQGYFIGAGASFKPFSKSNSRLGVNFAYAPRLEGEYKFSYIKDEKRFLGFSALDSTEGKTIGAYWSAGITPNISYVLSVDYYKFRMDLSEPPSTLSVPYVEERLMTFKASLNIRFDLF